MLAIVADDCVGQRVLTPKAKQEIGNGITGGIGGAGDRGSRKCTGISIAPVKRIDIKHLRADHHILIAHLQDMPLQILCEVEFRIEAQGVLELRISRLASQLVEPGYSGGYQTASQRRIGGKAGNAI